MSSSLPDGYTIRPAVEADLGAVVRVLNEFDRAFATGENVSEQDVLASWRDLREDGRAWIVLTADGEPAGYAEVFRREEEVTLDGYVLPPHWGRGIGDAIAALGEERARELGAGVVATGALAADERATVLFASRGWRRERVFLRMAIDLRGDERPPDPPPGVTLRTFRLDDARAFHAATEEAFADHWNFHPEPFERFRARAIETDEFDPALWWLIEDDGAIAATIRCTRKRFGSGWINSLGVGRSWRGRGLGRLLLLTAFAEFAARGEPRVALGVDADNPTGATRLYESVGMSVVYGANVFRKDLGSAGEGD